MTTKYHKEDFTINDFLEQVKDCNEEALIFNACYNPDFVEEVLNKNKNDFEPIEEFYDEKSDVVCFYRFLAEKSEAKTLKYFKEFLEIKNVNRDIPLNRDVEDGYVYANYDNIIFNKEIIVLC